MIRIGAAALGFGILAAWLTDRSAPKVALTGPEILVFSDVDCRDCLQWAQYLRSRGFRVHEDFDTPRNLIQDVSGVPRNLQGPFIGIVEGYLIEGHVSADDIFRLLKERPNARGLSVPGRPGKSPGMEQFSEDRKPYDVLLFDQSGVVAVYAHH